MIDETTINTLKGHNGVPGVLASGETVSAVKLTGASTVASTWAGVLATLKARIDADGRVGVTVDDVNKQLTLTAATLNTPFQLNGVYAGLSSDLASDPTVIATPAGADAIQVSKVVFADPTTGGYGLTAGHSFSVTVNDHVYTATVGQASVTGDWVSIFGKLTSLIEAGEHAALLDAQTAAMAKWWATDQQCRVLDECVQLHGGYGYMLDYPIARMWADARGGRIYGGANEIMKEVIARSL